MARVIRHQVRRYEQTGLNCGPNSLAQLLSFFGESVTPEELIAGTEMIQGTGTYDGHLGFTAIERGYKARVNAVNFYAHDPTWYGLPRNQLLKKLRAFRKTVREKLLRISLDGYIAFLEAGGTLTFEPMTRELLVKKLKKHPFIVGLSSTYLYKKKRPLKPKIHYRYGHFIVVHGYNPKTDTFSVVDPWHTIPMSKSGRYGVKADHLIASMYMGEATYDCTIVEIGK